MRCGAVRGGAGRGVAGMYLRAIIWDRAELVTKLSVSGSPILKCCICSFSPHEKCIFSFSNSKPTSGDLPSSMLYDAPLMPSERWSVLRLPRAARMISGCLRMTPPPHLTCPSGQQYNVCCCYWNCYYYTFTETITESYTVTINVQCLLVLFAKRTRFSACFSPRNRRFEVSEPDSAVRVSDVFADSLHAGDICAAAKGRGLKHHGANAQEGPGTLHRPWRQRMGALVLSKRRAVTGIHR